MLSASTGLELASLRRSITTAPSSTNAAHDSTGKRHDCTRNRTHGGHACLRSRESRLYALAQDEEVAAADGLAYSKLLLDDEFTFHDRHPPEASAIQQLAALEAITKVPELATHFDPVSSVKSIVAG